MSNKTIGNAAESTLLAQCQWIPISNFMLNISLNVCDFWNAGLKLGGQGGMRNESKITVGMISHALMS